MYMVVATLQKYHTYYYTSVGALEIENEVLLDCGYCKSGHPKIVDIVL